MRKIINNKLFILGGILALALLFVPHLVGAQSFISNIGVGVITIAFKVLAYTFNTILGFFFMMAGGLVNLAMSLNGQILQDSNALVKIGWTITRDVANLGFVLIMIVMAVATIVRYEKYSAQKLLPLLIGAAIIVNFSLTIAGVFINFSDTVSNAFSQRLDLGSGHIADALAGAFSPQRLLLNDTDNPLPPDPSAQGNAFSDISSAVLVSISGLIFNIVFLAIATLSMAALALMLFYRYIYLSILLVLAPLAWLFWVFPDLNSLFHEWWKNFIKWVFFLPAVTFFLYLAVEASIQLGRSPMFMNNSGFTSSLASIMAQGAQMIVLTGLLLGGLIAAQSMGIKGADGAMKLATKAKDGVSKAVGNYAKNRGQQLVTAPLRSEAGEKITKKLQTLGQNTWYGKILGAPVRGLGTGLANVRMKQEKKAADIAKGLPKDLNEQVNMAGSADAPELVAIMNNVASERNTQQKKLLSADKEIAEALEQLAKAGTNEDKKEKAQERLNKARGEKKDAQTNIGKVEKLMESLPNNIREGLNKAKNEKGEIELKNVDIPGIRGKLPQRYGYRKDSYIPGKNQAETVLEAAKKALEESGSGTSSKGGGEESPKERGAETKEGEGDKK